MNGLKNIMNYLYGGNKTIFQQNSKIINANRPLFSIDDRDIYAYDIIDTCDHRIATAVSKCLFQLVTIDSKSKKVSIEKDSLNDLFEGRMNPLCTSHDFFYKLTRLLLKNEDAFVYPQYTKSFIKNKEVRKYKAFYIIEKATIKIYSTDKELRIQFSDGSGQEFDMPYDNIIHIRYKYSTNTFYGGSGAGKDILNHLKTMNVIIESIPKSIEAGLQINGILTMRSVADADKKELTRSEFEDHLINSKYGIVATDYESDFTPININPKDIPENVLTFIREEILASKNMSMPIYLGKYTDEEFMAWYDTTIEDILLALTQAFNVVLLTPEERLDGKRIKSYDRRVQSLSIATRMRLLELAMPSALLDRAEQRELIGYQPDGGPERSSLNWIENTIANEYQLQKIAKGGKSDGQTNTG